MTVGVKRVIEGQMEGRGGGGGGAGGGEGVRVYMLTFSCASKQAVFEKIDDPWIWDQ